jgi:eukaryotic-like serine/threonine-protein kinase
MTPSQWQDVKRLFHEALDQQADGRADWIARRRGDPEIRAEVERLLTAHLAADDFIETPASNLLADPEPQAGARAGTWLGRYRLDALLGAGGMGEVYRAFDTDLRRAVAIKVVGRDEVDAHARLRREARNASRLNHPNICTIHHVGDFDGCPYIVMELVAGRPLAELGARGRIPTTTAVAYAIQILDALEHAHAHRVIHRDLKSANVMVAPDGRLTLLDFGLARHLDATAAGRHFEPSVDQTSTGGTLPYMSPETLSGRPADTRTDLWAFGVLLYELIAGRLPFGGRTADEVTAAILGQAPAPLDSDVPDQIAACIMGCLAKDPRDRPQRAGEVKAQLESDAGGHAGTSVMPGRPSGSTTRLTAAIAAVLLAAAGFGGWQAHSAGRPAAQPVRTIAVMPFRNVSGDRATDYFADGVTESFTGELGRTAGLRVTSPTTAMRYRETRLSPTDVATALNVAAVIYGSVRREGDRVRIEATLLRGGNQELWTGGVERPAREILALQRDLVRLIVSRLALATTSPEEARLSRVRSVDPDVYESFLKGRYYWNKRTPTALATAVEHFTAALARDPTFAPAYVGLANCYNQMGTVMVGSGSPVRMRPRAIAAAIAALQIDPELGEAHAALAYAKHYDWQWEAAGREFRRAVDLDGGNALVRVWYANYLVSLGRVDEAVVQVETARQLDPLSLVVVTNAGWTLSFAGRPQDAIDRYLEAIALDPDYVQAHMRLAGAYAGARRFDAALAESDTVGRLTGRHQSASIGAANIYALAGQRSESERLLREIVARARTEYVPPFALAQPYLLLGDYDRAFALLERAYDERSNGMAYLAVDPMFVPVHDDPRYVDLLKRVGLAR